ncbi:MAG TPA: methylmalonyl Co-A mutase-associated GTPase MeaB [Acidobacteriaceae bacterium]|jgi:LAO/AO transport system kinase|nr:methylmalonyl Co-A mutase-associated GTPase MeaB [Acidobacteriaceae bacterium]
MSERDLKIAGSRIGGQAGERSGDKTTVELLLAAVRRGETRALARAVSLVEDGAAEAADLLELCGEALQGRERAFRVGITGPAGAGKSTLVDGLTRELRRQGRRVGIVAVDPSSAFSGGAILGDRIRLTDLAGDPGIYMRSMATRGHLGGLARATDDVLTVIEAAWAGGMGSEASDKDVLLIETTGVGQGEIEVVGLADAVAVVLVPGMGDSVQSLKAGVLEIASVFVLNKADQPGVERLEAEIAEMLMLSAVVSGAHPEGGVPKVLKTVATAGEGVGELLGALDEFAAEGVSRRKIGGTNASEVKAPAYLLGPVLDHLGIAVRSIADSLRLYEALGAVVSGVEEVAHERVRVAMIAMGESRIELLEATEADSAVGRFVAKRGEGLHHVALRVPDLTAAVERMKEMGVRLVSETIQVGAGGHRYVFVHPQSANGVLLELVEAGDKH